jgi:hypothetical protein
MALKMFCLVYENHLVIAWKKLQLFSLITIQITYVHCVCVEQSF